MGIGRVWSYKDLGQVVVGDVGQLLAVDLRDYKLGEVGCQLVVSAREVVEGWWSVRHGPC